MRSLQLRPFRTIVATSIVAACWAAAPASAALATEPEGDGVVSVIDDPRVALALTHPADWVLADEPIVVQGENGTDPCNDVLAFALGIEHDTRVQSAISIELVPADCEPRDDQIGNGWHGLYRTIDDAPDPLDIEHVDTPVGEAAVFDQDYYECTNECHDYVDHVAIVTLDEPADTRYPTVVIRDDAGQLDGGDLDDDEFDALLQSLTRLDDTAGGTVASTDG